MRAKNVPRRYVGGCRRRNAVSPSARNLKLEIEYDGTNYCGWQTQSNNRHKKSLQEVIENTLQQILQEKIRLIASGRTDAGVHALAQVANFRTKSPITAKKLQRALNGLLPADITISRIEEVSLAFHSRFAAKSKVYRYSILNSKYPRALLRNYVYFCPYPLNLSLMRSESKVLLGRHNFQAFQTTGHKQSNAVRTIKKLQIRRDNDLIYIVIEADGFLQHMVRRIVGALIEIGRGKLPKGSLKQMLLFKNRQFTGHKVAAAGLCLIKVNYY